MEQVVANINGLEVVEEVDRVDTKLNIEALSKKSVVGKEEYPNIVILDTSLPKFVFKQIKSMLNIDGRISQDISIYLDRGGKRYRIGKLAGVQVGALVELVGLDKLEGYLDRSNRLVGQNLYILNY